jgi:uncharacterized protein YdiU (UPF0061 family)
MIKNTYKGMTNFLKSNPNISLKNISEIKFENSYINNLYINKVTNPKTPQTTKGCNFTYVEPTPINNPRLIYLSPLCCEFLKLDLKTMIENSDESAEYLSGNKLIVSSVPVAQCYVGHQFGILAGQLGDGRAITLGDMLVGDGLYELQLKGSGLTPYSRFADGRAVLRSSIREFLCSEHLWSLGIPTTRALSLVGSDTTVQRDPLYSGNVIYEQCAVVCRLSPTFLRFGSFEIFLPKDPLSGSMGPSNGLETEMLPKMLNYLGKFHFNKLYTETCDNLKNFVNKLFLLTTIRSAILAAYWQSYAFCHGVLNTDNMSILGLTIDFGPFGFMEFFDNFYVCNNSDKHGRYAYMKQPEICKWNLNKLSEILKSIVDEKDLKEIIDNNYDKIYKEYFYTLNNHKLGLFLSSGEKNELIDNLYMMMENFGFDFTLFFRYLSEINEKEESLQNFISKLTKYSLNYDMKLKKIRPSINETGINKLKDFLDSDPMVLYSYGLEPDFVKTQMNKHTEFEKFKVTYPNAEEYEKLKLDSLNNWLQTYVNYLEKEYEKLKTLNIKDFKENMTYLLEDNFMFKYPLPKNVFQNKLQESINLSISEIEKSKLNPKNFEEFNYYKKNYMDRLNPKFILRNHVAQRVIERAENGEYDELDRVFNIITQPFDEHSDVEFSEYDTSTLLAYNICVSCSS